MSLAADRSLELAREEKDIMARSSNSSRAGRSKGEDLLALIEAFNQTQGGGVIIRKDASDYSLVREDTAIEAGSLHETIPGIISLPKDLHFILTEIRKYGGRNALMDISVVGGTFTGTPFSLDELIEALQEHSP